MMEISEKVIVVCDSSKFLRKSFVKIASISEVDVIITDTGIPAAEKAKLLEMHVDLNIV